LCHILYQSGTCTDVNKELKEAITKHKRKENAACNDVLAFHQMKTSHPQLNINSGNNQY